MNKIELPRIVGISGRKNSGKDLVGEILQRLTVSNDITLNYDHDNNLYLRNEKLPEYHVFNQPDPTHRVMKFADKIKDIVCLLIGCKRDDLEDREFKNKELGGEWNNMTPREFLQLLGTEACRNVIHPDIWVNALFANYDTSSNYDSNWIITDVRFENECQAIKDRGGIIIRINRDSDVVDDHTSETALDNYDGFDFVVDNNGSIDDLTNNLIKIINND